MAVITDEELRQRTRDLLAEVPPDRVDRVTFRGAQYDRGLAWVHFPEGKGGLGLDPKAQTVVDEVLRTAPVYYDDLAVNPIGIGMGAPTVLTYGTEEMHERFLRRIFTGEDIWCQLFSEPGAGSDVAGLATRAELDGDEWVVNGQKVWTTLAHVSNFGMLLARTDPDQPKHKGLTYFVLDMHAPGVEVRPLYQITGEAEFNEVFLTDVRVPDSMRLGERGEGWRVAITTLMNERVALGGGVRGRGQGPIAELVSVWDKHRDGLDPASRAVYRDRVTDLWIRAEVLRLTNLRARQNATAGNPGPEGSVGKLATAELNKAIYECALDLLGAEGMLFPGGYQLARPERTTLAGGSVQKTFLRMRAQSIEGGTSEVMRNILGERVLGLPGEPRVDKDVPWTEVPRSS
ncbi:MAG: acyl-CoA dehydrogenase [Actinomyces sp.]|nr:MAG: acyl-CoA dehydrogenase [Actinomyces sp.]